MFTKLKIQISKLLRVFNSIPEIGGIEISDSAIKFALAKDGKSVFASLNLASGIVSEGKVLDKNKLKELTINTDVDKLIESAKLVCQTHTHK